MAKRNRPMGKHHRKCRSNGGTDDPQNISIVPVFKHRSYHNLFQNGTPEEVARILNETWIDTDWVLIAVHKETGISLKQILSQVKP